MLTACVSVKSSKLAEICSVAEANVTIARDGMVVWNGTSLGSDDDLNQCMKIAASAKPKPRIHLRPTTDASFASVQRVINAAQRVGLADRFAFVVEPN